MNVINNFKYGTEIIVPNVWLKEMHNGILAFNSKNIWGGIKSFKISCIKVAKYSCAPHPHNYHIEILVSVGLIGYLILLIIFLKYFYNVLKKKYLYLKKRKFSSFNFFNFIFY